MPHRLEICCSGAVGSIKQTSNRTEDVQDDSQKAAQRGILLLEIEDVLCVNGSRLEKPFLERSIEFVETQMPRIYYPSRQGGGTYELFNLSSGPKWIKDTTPGTIRAITNPIQPYSYESILEGAPLRAFVVNSQYVHTEIDVSRPGKTTTITTLTEEELDMTRRVVTGLGLPMCIPLFARKSGRSLLVDVDEGSWRLKNATPGFYDCCAAELTRMFLDHKRKLDETFKTGDTKREGLKGYQRYIGWLMMLICAILGILYFKQLWEERY